MVSKRFVLQIRDLSQHLTDMYPFHANVATQQLRTGILNQYLNVLGLLIPDT